MEISLENRSAQYEIQNKTVKLREINFKNYPECNPTATGYDLISRDDNGNIIKIQHSVWRNKGTNMSKIIYKPFVISDICKQL